MGSGEWGVGRTSNVVHSFDKGYSSLSSFILRVIQGVLLIKLDNFSSFQDNVFEAGGVGGCCFTKG